MVLRYSEIFVSYISEQATFRQKYANIHIILKHRNDTTYNTNIRLYILENNKNCLPLTSTEYIVTYVYILNKIKIKKMLSRFNTFLM